MSKNTKENLLATISSTLFICLVVGFMFILLSFTNCGGDPIIEEGADVVKILKDGSVPKEDITEEDTINIKTPPHGPCGTNCHAK